jgi:hypothetical protein
MCGGMYASFIIMLCGQYDILYANLKNLGKVNARVHQSMIRKERKNFNADNEEWNQYLVSEEKVDDIENIAIMYMDETEAVNDCVRHHEMIIEFSKMLQDVYSIFISSKLFYSSKFVTEKN